jgi:hypothetical protein
MKLPKEGDGEYVAYLIGLLGGTVLALRDAEETAVLERLTDLLDQLRATLFPDLAEK